MQVSNGLVFTTLVFVDLQNGQSMEPPHPNITQKITPASQYQSRPMTAKTLSQNRHENQKLRLIWASVYAYFILAVRLLAERFPAERAIG